MKRIIGNFKNRLTKDETTELLGYYKDIFSGEKERSAFCVPFNYAETSIKEVGNSAEIIVQNLKAFGDENYASPEEIKKLGAKWVLIGHSDFRKSGETNEIIKSKVKLAIEKGISVLFCLGETLEEYESGKTFEILKAQLEAIKNTDSKKIIIAYEPVYSIGTSKPANIYDVNEAITFINEEFYDYPILYGGSVNSSNAREYLEHNLIGGVLIGGASLDKKEMELILSIAKEI